MKDKSERVPMNETGTSSKPTIAGRAKQMKMHGLSFSALLFAFQILLLGLFAGFISYGEPVDGAENLKYYPQFQDVHVMIFVGFGFLMTFLSKYGFGSVSYNMLLSSVTVQWGTLLNAWIRQRVMKSEGHFNGTPEEITVGVKEMMTGDFTAAAVLISFGAVLGKASRLQLLVMTIFECIFFAVNEMVLVEYLKISDVGGSIIVHLFGAYFGLAVSAVLRNYEDPKEKEGSNYHSDIFAMIGTIFLWVYWPSFNAGPLGDSPTQQNRALVNTYFSLAACTTVSFVMSALVEKDHKLNMVHIQNATIAGGVAVGTCADLNIQPWGAILIGMIAAIISVLGYRFLTPALNSKGIHDTCGVHNLHGMPAVFAAIAGAIAAATISNSTYPRDDFYSIYPARRSLKMQAGYQFAACVVSFTFAIVGGLVTGLIIKFLDPLQDDDNFDDKREFQASAENFTIVSTREEEPLTQAV